MLETQALARQSGTGRRQRAIHAEHIRRHGPDQLHEVAETHALTHEECHVGMAQAIGVDLRGTVEARVVGGAENLGVDTVPRHRLIGGADEKR